MPVALIDGDILCYRIGFSTMDESEAIAKIRMDNYIEEILFNSNCSDYQVFLSGNTNFRKDIFPGYKGHRKAPRPKHYHALRGHLLNVEWASLSDGQEADDDMGIAQYTDYINMGVEDDYGTMICTIDKDLDMIPGLHFNFVKNSHYEINEDDAIRNFYKQLLTGDKTDNIPGIYGLGDKKAMDIINSCPDEEVIKEKVFKSYLEYFPHCTEEGVLNHINIIGRLLWIRRKEDEVWSFD